MQEINKDYVKAQIELVFESMRDIRRYLHRNPELSTCETQTAAYVAGILDTYGIEYKTGFSGTGLIAHIYGKEGGRCVALRADMDALPIKEENNHAYISQNHGVMHACGHDAHMASLLGAAKVLYNSRAHWKGCIKLIFQPSEEDFRAGAKVMIEQGALKNPEAEAILAFHVLPELPCGYVGFKSGKYMASTDEIYLTVKGKGGHAATPEQNVDSVLISAYILTALQQIVSRQAPPYIPTVLSFGRIIGEGRTNIIPHEVSIDGTLRTFDEKWRAKALESIRNTASHIAASMGGECIVKIDPGYPFVYNNPDITEISRRAAQEYLGKEYVKELELRMTAEDFAYYAQKIPACLFRVGTGAPGKDYNLHTPQFDIDENALKISAGLTVFAALSLLKK